VAVITATSPIQLWRKREGSLRSFYKRCVERAFSAEQWNWSHELGSSPLRMSVATRRKLITRATKAPRLAFHLFRNDANIYYSFDANALLAPE